MVLDKKDANSNPLAKEIEEQIVSITPTGTSKFAVNPFFHDMLRRVAQGQTIKSIAIWSKGKGHPVKPPQISAYLAQHLPHLSNPQVNIARNNKANTPVDPAHAMELQCKDLEKAIEAEKRSMTKHGLLSSTRLLELQKANGVALGQLGRIKLDRSRMRELEEADSTDVVVDMWTPMFAAAVAQMIVEERSKANGRLRGFQPEKLEDDG